VERVNKKINELRHRRNVLTVEIAKLKKEGKDFKDKLKRSEGKCTIHLSV